MKLIICLLFFGILGLSAQEEVKVSVFYESLCPDSIRFIRDQLTPNFQTVKDYISVDFVPYGKATHTLVDGKWVFQCQHGEPECHGNLLQTCGLAENTDQTTQVNFVNCVMSTANPSLDSNVEQCATANGISWSNILECSQNGEGDDLMAEFGDRTHAVTPTITFIPTIVYNDVFDATLQNDSIYDFLSTVCSVIGNNVC